MTHDDFQTAVNAVDVLCLSPAMWQGEPLASICFILLLSRSRMSKLLRTLLFISGFSPVLLSLAAVRYFQFGWHTEIWQLVLIGFLGIAIPYLLIKEISVRAEIVEFCAKKIEPNDQMLLTFLLSYVSPFIARMSGLDFDSILICVILLAIVLWFIPSLPAHPVLRLFSIYFYKVESDAGMVYTVISRQELLAVSQLTQVHQISSTMLMKAG